MALKAFEEFTGEPLAFPIGGKLYTVPLMGYRDGIRLQGVLAGTDKTLDDAAPEEGWKLVLGSAWDQMVTDNVPVAAMSRAGFAAMADFTFGRAAAEQMWETGLPPEALAAAMTAATPKAKPRKPSSTAAARRTRSAGSTSGTSSPKGSSRRKAKAPAKASQS